MRDPVPHAEFAGGRAPVGRPRTARSLWILGAVLLASAMAFAPAPARAASVLSNRHVSPGSGTTATVFTFSVDYNSSNPVRNATAVWAEFGGTTVPLALASGNTHAGTWTGTSTLPVGSFTVTFHASISASPQPDPLDGPTITVTLAATNPDAGTHPAAHSDADPSTDRRADANAPARRDANPGDAAARKHAASLCPRSAADSTARWE